MGKREVIGAAICPECESADAEIRRQGNGLAYRYCFDCGAQYFARSPEASDRLIATMKNGPGRPVAVAAEPTEPTEPTKPAKPASQPAGRPADQPTEPAKPADRPTVKRQSSAGLSIFGRGAA